MSGFLDIGKVLVPVDFSESGGEVLDYAVDVARDRGAALTLLHVVGIPVAPFDPAYGLAADPKILLDLQAAAEKELRKTADRIEKKDSPRRRRRVRDALRIRTRVLVGSPSREIVREAKEWGADLIVLGSHGRTGLRHVFLGSVAENVLRQAPCPVLTVRLRGFRIESLK